VDGHPRTDQPSIEAGLAGDDGVYVNPMTLNVSEEEMLLPCLCTAVEAIMGGRRIAYHMPTSAADGGWRGVRSL
jgi:hypothetical protein